MQCALYLFVLSKNYNTICHHLFSYFLLKKEVCIQIIKMLLQSVKLIYILLLLVLFIVYFGIPNLKKFLEQKTIFLESNIKDKMLFTSFANYILP